MVLSSLFKGVTGKYFQYFFLERLRPVRPWNCVIVFVPKSHISLLQYVFINIFLENYRDL